MYKFMLMKRNLVKSSLKRRIIEKLIAGKRNEEIKTSEMDWREEKHRWQGMTNYRDLAKW